MWWWLASTALAGSVYVNGVNVDSLRDATFEDVTVTIDANGDVRIDAPGYTIEVVEPASPPPAPGARTTPQPTAPAPQPTARPAPQPTAQPAPAPRPPAPAPAQAASGIPQGTWWLVSEDAGSVGHVVQVKVNGRQVSEIRSGGEPVILDLAPYLQRGTNQVELVSQSTNAGGGAMYVYIGKGSNDSGTLVMETPQVQYGLGPSRKGEYRRTYQVTVP